VDPGGTRTSNPRMKCPIGQCRSGDRKTSVDLPLHQPGSRRCEPTIDLLLSRGRVGEDPVHMTSVLGRRGPGA
jgi:hypothetical protein